MRFMVDHMLYKLGRYLRCMGHDAAWDPRASTNELVRRANVEGRTFLTRNRRFVHQHPQPQVVHLVAANDPVDQVHELIAARLLDPGAELFTRCVRCNEPLAALPARSPRLDSLPERVRGRYRDFFTCPSCATVFWRGSHVTNTCRKLGLPDAAEPASGGDATPGGQTC
jgi:uncharacterized protein with PIN domain